MVIGSYVKQETLDYFERAVSDTDQPQLRWRWPLSYEELEALRLDRGETLEEGRWDVNGRKG